MPDLPLLVFGPRSLTYDFGPSHPLTPRRFGPGIDLLRELGAEPGLAPEPASDDELRLCHTARYIEVVKRFSEADLDPWGESEAGIGPGDDPPFHGMHEAGAAVAGGSLRAIEAILRGDVLHAFHPGGGLHHAMPSRAAGFCIYNDVALAVERARRDGLRVLYVDLDVHHGDGVEAIFRDDPGVLTVSFHESGRYLFPGTGFPDDLGDGAAAGTSVNVPFEPLSGERAWLSGVEAIVPPLAAAFGPDIIVSQHGADSHAWDPLAHLRVTTTVMGAAARLIDRVAHRYARGRWLATGGGGYDAYRVVPRSWSHVWLAGAHREVPDATPGPWRQRWSAESARYGQAPPPRAFDDPPNAGEPFDSGQAAADDESIARWAVIRGVVVPGLLVAAEQAGWWSPLDDGSPDDPAAAVPSSEPAVVALTPERLERLRIADRVVAPFGAPDALSLLTAALRADRGATAMAAVSGDVIVGLAVLGPSERAEESAVLALGVAPPLRGQGLGTALLSALARSDSDRIVAPAGVADRDVVDPLPYADRLSIARRVMERAGFTVVPAVGAFARIDPGALLGIRG
ncbi:MAG: acetoin utilization AcuC family protein [Chloroflexota bacterium]